MIGAVLFKREHAHGAIDVTLHEMAAESPIRSQCALEVHRGVTAERPEVRAIQCFLQQIERQLLVATRLYRQQQPFTETLSPLRIPSAIRGAATCN
jgi:hypothetical protein